MLITDYIIKSSIALMLFIAGSTTFLNGYFLLYDDRKLNRYLSSLLLMLNGGNIILGGFKVLGFDIFAYFQFAMIIFQTIVGILSTILIQEYRIIRDAKIGERKIIEVEKAIIEDIGFEDIGGNRGENNE